MDFNDISFSTLNETQRIGQTTKTHMYHDDKFYYKVFGDISPDNRTSLAYYTINGLDFVWEGNNQLAIDKVGLLVPEVCPAFYDYIYNGDVCCGYITRKGVLLSDIQIDSITHFKYLKFVKRLADISAKEGWGYVSVGTNNVIIHDDTLSFIDLDFAPIKLHHGKHLTDIELKIWENEFRSEDSLYFNMLRTNTLSAVEVVNLKAL